MRNLRLLTLGLLVLGVAVAAPAQTYKDLYDMTLNSTDVWEPEWLGVFAQARDGNLYSTSQLGGTLGKGVVFRLTPAGQVTVLHSFDGTNGGVPRGGLTLGTDGNLYGTTCQGGSFNNGTVFRIATTGGSSYSVVHNFDVNKGEGYCPEAAPVQGTDGNFYGTTSESVPGSGTVYKMTPSGTPLKTLHVFDQAAHADGQTPGAIIQGTDGSFYGTTQTGGASDQGTVFKITAAGTLFKLLHSFSGPQGDGSKPFGPIIQARDGNFYGTEFDGQYIYKITPTGSFSRFFTLTSQTGAIAEAGLIQATDGKFYGAMQFYGAGYGTILQLTPTGMASVPHNFDYTHGGGPQVSVFQHTNGILYGDTTAGGTSTKPGGVLYSLDMGLHPFVALLTTSGIAGQAIQILGNGLTGTTSVKFGSGSASFKVVSDTYMTATVPATGTSGAVTVTVPSGIRVSSKNFRVRPGISSFSPTSGPVGSQVVITGTGLTQTTKVTFGGVAATNFTKSATQVTANVPTGAVTGKIGITTAGGVAISSGTFTVTNSLLGRCVVSNGKMTGYCVGVRSGVCREAFDPTNCPQGQSVTNVVVDQCAQSTFTVDGSRACTP
jgi:uncharacterized repeat protein (TIGR03803 family)